MDLAALALAAVALLVALAAWRAAAGLRRGVEEARDESRRRAQGLADEVREVLQRERRLLAQVAAGAKLDREQILEGRLWRDVSTAEGVQLVAAGAVQVLDVRSPRETADGILPGALRIPIEELEARAHEIPRDGRPLLVYCAGGQRSAAACEMLSEKGFEDLCNLAEGYLSWSGPSTRP